MDAVILAAGFGSRFGKTSEESPKSLLQINQDETILKRTLTMLTATSIKKIYVLIGHLGKKIEKLILTLKFDNVELVSAKNYEKGPLFTFQNIMNIEIDKNFLLCPSDIYFKENFYKLFIQECKDNQILIPYSKKISKNITSKLYISVKPPLKILGFNELMIEEPNEVMIPIPIIYLNKTIFPFVNEAIRMGYTRVIDALNLFLKENKLIYGIDFSRIEWFDIDTMEIFKQLKEDLKG